MKKKRINSVLFSALMLVCTLGGAQQLNYTLSRDFLWGFDKAYNNVASGAHTFIKPYRFEDLKKIPDSSAAFPRLLAGTKAEEFDRKAKGQIEVYPVMTAEAGYDMAASNLTSDLAIGGNLLAYWKDKIAFNLKIVGGRTVLNSYQDSVVRMTHVVPGLGYAYKANNDSLFPAYAYQYFSGYVSWSPNKIFNIQAGQDKHFWGDGYRSLFLSDASVPYPFLKVSADVWHLQYVCLYTILKDVTNPSGFKKDWLPKYSTLHYLGWNVTKRINVGLFESIVWQGSDTLRSRGYDVNYLNPVLFFRPTEYSAGSSDNALIGGSMKIKAANKLQVYGQVLLDEFYLKEIIKNTGYWANKYGTQLGFKAFDLFTVKRLNFQIEYNSVRPYTYSHANVPQNYGHFNQSLAHPLGANFRELANFINYRYKRLFIEAKYVYSAYGADSLGSNAGGNIFMSYTTRDKEYANRIGQGKQVHLSTLSVRAAYMLDTRMDLKIELGFAQRMEYTATASSSIPCIFFGIRSDLSNLYSDY